MDLLKLSWDIFTIENNNNKVNILLFFFSIETCALCKCYIHTVEHSSAIKNEMWR